jgi:hypothetical protein
MREKLDLKQRSKQENIYSTLFYGLFLNNHRLDKEDNQKVQRKCQRNLERILHLVFYKLELIESKVEEGR